MLLILIPVVFCQTTKVIVNQSEGIKYNMKQIDHMNTSFGCVQGNDGFKGEKGEVGAGNPGSPGLRGKDVSKSRAQSG